MEIAKKNISTFKFIGITERFRDSLDLLSYTFGWRPIADVPMYNVNTQKQPNEKLDTETINGILECTKLDRELYKFATHIFETRFSQMIDELKIKHWKSDFQNIPSSKSIETLLTKDYDYLYFQSQPKFDQIDFNFSNSLLGNGWHGIEKYPNGTHFRWSGSTKSTIDFSLNKEFDYKIKFCISSFLGYDVIESLILLVNGHTVKTNFNKDSNGKIIFEGIIPKETLQSSTNFTRLTFLINRIIRPHSVIPNSLDDRELGLAFEWIKIRKNTIPQDNQFMTVSYPMAQKLITLLQKKCQFLRRQVADKTLDGVLSQMHVVNSRFLYYLNDKHL